MRTKWMVLLLAGLILFSCLRSSPDRQGVEDTHPTESAAAIPGTTSSDTSTKPAPTTTRSPTTTTAAPTTATTAPTTSAPTTTNPPPTTTKTNPPTTTTTTTPTTTVAAHSQDDEVEEGVEKEELGEEEGLQPPPAEAEVEEAAETQEQQLEEEAAAVPEDPAPAVADDPSAIEEEQPHEDAEDNRVYDVTVSTVEFMPGLVADVHAPTQPGDYPVVTLTFGRGWSIGDRSQLTALAQYLASRGMVAVNGEYRTLLRGGRLSTMAEEVACLAAAAPEIARPHLRGPAAPVWLLGYSAGAHLAALATLESHPLPHRCPHPPTDIAGMIGLGGPYDLDELWNSGVPDYFFDHEALAEDLPYLEPVLRRGDAIAMQLFFRLITRLTPDDAETWDALNPLALADQPPQRSFLLVTGDQDELIYPLHAERFAEALISGGHNVELRIIPHTDHQALFDPAHVGEAIRSFVGAPP